MLAALVALALLVANPLSTPALRDITGRMVIGTPACGFDGFVSAPEICQGGHVRGVYLDDTTPNLPFWIARARAKYGYVLVARPPGAWSCPWQGVRCIHEVYRCRGQWRLRAAARYILQWRYHRSGCPAPSMSQTVGLVVQALKYKPWLIFTY